MTQKPLFILPFDHRSSFAGKMVEAGSKNSLEKIKEMKGIIYSGFKLAMAENIPPKEYSGILIDEQYGDEIIRDAVSSGYIVCLSTEKSGQKEFDFEYGDGFGIHLDKYRPDFAKALVRYNPKDDKELNRRQIKKLKELGDFCREKKYKFILEFLVPATEEQLKSFRKNRRLYDLNLRPGLMVETIKQLQEGGVDPDIWKIEGLEEPEQYRKIVSRIRAGGRADAGVIVLGRGSDDRQIEQWLRAAASVDGIVGFAVGRTIFWDPLIKYRNAKIGKEEASRRIAKKFQHFYRVFALNN